MASAVETYEAACNYRDELKKKLLEKTQPMLRVLQALQTVPPTVSVNSAPPDYSHFSLSFENGDTFHSSHWLTGQELAKMMAAIPIAEKAANDSYNAMGATERRLIPRR